MALPTSRLSPAALTLLFCSFATPPGVPDDNPLELGRVQWRRDLEGALAEAGEQGIVFALFQEIPGCATCRRFGEGPLSHPLLVEAIEDLFTPLAIYNNRGGEDAGVLQRYDEPAWNNPVVRFLDGEGADVLPRRDRVWSTEAVAGRMVQALETTEREVPLWLELVQREAKTLKSATFAMHCFWEGEVRLGGLFGVVHTRAGWLDGREVVEVRYDPERIDYARLVEEAKRMHCATRIYARDEAQRKVAGALVGERARLSTEVAGDAPESDQKRHLRRTDLALLPLTPMQRTKVNAALGSGTDPYAWLSPRQETWLAHIADVRARTPQRLEGLVAPDEIVGLAAYTGELLERLQD